MILLDTLNIPFFHDHDLFWKTDIKGVHLILLK